MRVRYILCPIDFSRAASQALAYATAFAGSYQAEIIALHVFTPPLGLSHLLAQYARSRIRLGCRRPVNEGAWNGTKVLPTAALCGRVQRCVDRRQGHEYIFFLPFFGRLEGDEPAVSKVEPVRTDNLQTVNHARTLFARDW